MPSHGVYLNVTDVTFLRLSLWARLRAEAKARRYVTSHHFVGMWQDAAPRFSK